MFAPCHTQQIHANQIAQQLARCAPRMSCAYAPGSGELLGNVGAQSLCAFVAHGLPFNAINMTVAWRSGLGQFGENIRPKHLEIHQSCFWNLPRLSCFWVGSEPLRNRLRLYLAKPCNFGCSPEVIDDFFVIHPEIKAYFHFKDKYAFTLFL